MGITVLVTVWHHIEAVGCSFRLTSLSMVSVV